MKNNKYIIGITCVGDEIGQAVIRSCRLSNLPLLTIGIGKNPYAFGMYDCDSFEMTPSIYDDTYLPILVQICIDNKVDVLIPGHPDEVLLYSENQEMFLNSGIKTIVPGEKLIRICRNKDTMGDYFGSLEHFLVKKYTASEILNLTNGDKIIFPLIAKPKIGFGSRSIRIIHSIEQLIDLPSDFTIQELASPSSSDLNYKKYIESINKDVNLQVSEISIQLVFDKHGGLLGRMSSFNRLTNGIPIEILPLNSQVVWEAVDSLQPLLTEAGLRGPLNIQGRITDHGFKIFEMNPRFTAMSGVRALMGFNEVDCCIRSWLDLPSHPINLNFNRFGLRQTSDKVVDIKRNQDVHKDFLYINKAKDGKGGNILVSGTNEPLGQHIISSLVNTDYKIHVLAENKDKLRRVYPKKEIVFYDYNDLQEGILSLGNIDTIIHLGFFKGKRDYLGIAESLRVSSILFSKAVLSQVPAMINISSNIIYGRDGQLPWKEFDDPSPHSSYTSAIYAMEMLLKYMSAMEKQVRGTSLRLATLSGGNLGFDSNELIYKMVKRIINSKPIIINEYNQPYQILDYRDAAKGIMQLLEVPATKWKSTYNVGSSKLYLLKDIAKKVINISHEYVKMYPVELTIKENNEKTGSHMDTSLFMGDVGWSPQYTLDDIIHSIFQRIIKRFYQHVEGYHRV